MVGTTSLDFSAGLPEASVDVVSGVSGLTAASYLEAFQMAEASANRTADENRIDGINLICEYLSATSFRIYGYPKLGTVIGIVPVRWVAIAS